MNRVGDSGQPAANTMSNNTQLIQLTLFDLEALERTVRQGLKTFIETGDALVKIRDAGGYTLRGYATFEDYCEREFGFSVRHGQRLIAAARTAELVERVTGQAPANEAAAREFSKVAGEPDGPTLVEQVQQTLAANGYAVGDAPAHVIKQAVDAVLPKPTPAPPDPDPDPDPGDDEDGDEGDDAQQAPRPAAPAVIPAKAGTKPTAKPKAEPMPDANAAGAASGESTDFCPACGDWTEVYHRKGDAWYCGTCRARVVISVQPFEEEA